jgi:hypothetical protein
MPDFYYIDLYFDLKEKGIGEVVEGCIAALEKAGCSFKRTTFFEPPETGLSPYFAPGTSITLDGIGRLAEDYTGDREKKGLRFISFPPWGRIAFEFDFSFDEELLEDLAMEEEDTKTSASELGLSFFLKNSPGGRAFKATLNVWEEYLLTYGTKSTNMTNMMNIIRLVESIYTEVGPYFGAMNNEIRLNADKSRDNLVEGRLPSGNEYVLVGSKLLSHLDMEQLKSSGLKWKTFPDGGVMIQFYNRWGQAEPRISPIE